MEICLRSSPARGTEKPPAPPENSPLSVCASLSEGPGETRGPLGGSSWLGSAAGLSPALRFPHDVPLLQAAAAPQSPPPPR